MVIKSLLTEEWVLIGGGDDLQLFGKLVVSLITVSE